MATFQQSVAFVAYDDQPNRRFRLASLLGLAGLGAWIMERTLLASAHARIRAKIAALSKEMGLRSAEVIAFPTPRRRHPSPLLKLSQRAERKARTPKPSPQPSHRKRR
ncbi:MAG: hypothetical protein ACYDD1_07190 [Caulobacteraceae bacterium]